MNPERIARLVGMWARFYTRGVPAPLARRRIEEIDADLHGQIAHGRAQRVGERRIALGLLSRMARGVAADASWRRRHAVPGPVGRSIVRVALATALVLLVPLLAMQFSDAVVWTPFDFAFAGIVLFGAGLTYLLVARRVGLTAYRAAVAVAVGSALLLVWLVAAVGVIGEDGDPADLLYGAVLAVGVAGAAIARLRPAGMARALLAMALAQGVVAIVALAARKHEAPISSVPELLGLNGFFAVLFCSAALLFRRAAREGSEARSAQSS